MSTIRESLLDLALCPPGHFGEGVGQAVGEVLAGEGNNGLAVVVEAVGGEGAGAANRQGGVGEGGEEVGGGGEVGEGKFEGHRGLRGVVRLDD